MCLVMTLSPVIVAADEVTLTGRVLGPGDEAVAGATVRVLYYLGPLAEPQVAEGTSNADGGFALSFDDDTAEPRYRVAASAEGFSMGSRMAAAGEPAEIRLADREQLVRGRVVDGAGNPIGGAEVWLNAAIGDPIGEEDLPAVGRPLAPLAVTDADGRFALHGLPTGLREVALAVDAAGFGGWRGGDAGMVPVTQEAAIVLQPEAVIAGSALADGEPVAGVLVMARSQRDLPRGEGQAVTGADGRYEIHGLWPSSYDVMVGAPDEWTAPAAQGIAVQAGERVDGVDPALVRSVRVDLTLTAADTGEALTQARLSATSPARPVTATERHSAQADGSGRLTLFLPPGEATLTCMLWGERQRGELEPVTVEAPAELSGGRMEVEVTLRPALVLAGTVAGPDGRPVEGATVMVQALGRETDVRAVTDGEGRFSMRSWESVLQELRCMAWVPDESSVGFTRPQRGAEDVHIALRPAAVLVLRLEDLEGNPVPGVEMTVGQFVSLDGTRSAAYPLPITWASDEQGVLRMGPLPSGVRLMPHVGQTVYGMIPDERYTETFRKLQPLTLEAGETRDLGTIVLASGQRALSGVVLRDGEPEAEAWVLAAAKGLDEPLLERSDEQGRFEFAGLPPVGEVTVIALDERMQVAAGALLEGDVAAPLALDLKPLASVEGTVIGADGRPVEGARVSLSVPGATTSGAGAGPGVISTVAQADAQGRWRVDGLIAGLEYRIALAESLDDGPFRAVPGTDTTIRPDGEAEPFVVDIDLRPRGER